MHERIRSNLSLGWVINKPNWRVRGLLGNVINKLNWRIESLLGNSKLIRKPQETYK